MTAIEQRVAALEQQLWHAERTIEELKAEIETLNVYFNALRGRVDHGETRDVHGGGSPYRVGQGHYR